jgi:lipopolysaccharide export LptBFGC system permease protein LptF
MYLPELGREKSAVRGKYLEAKAAKELAAQGISPSPSPTPTPLPAAVKAATQAGAAATPAPSPPSAQDLKKRYNKLRTELGRRFSMPYAAFILALVAMPLGIHPARAQRTWGVGLSATLGLAVFVFYYALLSIGVALGENGIVNPYLGLWLPNIAATLVAAFCLYKVCTEQWQSITHGLEEIVGLAGKLFARFAPSA